VDHQRLGLLVASSRTYEVAFRAIYCLFPVPHVTKIPPLMTNTARTKTHEPFFFNFVFLLRVPVPLSSPLLTSGQFCTIFYSTNYCINPACRLQREINIHTYTYIQIYIAPKIVRTNLRRYYFLFAGLPLPTYFLPGVGVEFNAPLDTV